MQRGPAQTADRALRMLLAFEAEGQELGVAEFAAILGVHKSTASRLAATLAARGFLERAPAGDAFRLGPQVGRLGLLASGSGDLIAVARQEMDDLAARVGETVNLAILDGAEVVIIAQVEGRHIVGVGTWTARRTPLHAAAAGKVFLAFGAAELQEERFERFTARTLTKAEELRSQVEEIRRSGWASAIGEFHEDLHAVAAPIFDGSGRCRAALSISAPHYRMPLHRLPAMAAASKEAASRIGTRLGWRGLGLDLAPETETQRVGELRERYRMGIDIGGTFTDFVVLDHSTGRMRVEKVPSTPDNFRIGIEAGIEKLGVELTHLAMMVHGTTVGLNALLERKGKPTGLITTKGFRDVYEIGRHNRTEMYDLFYRKPSPLVPRRLRLEVEERLDADGNVVTPLVEEDVLRCIRTFREEEINAIAVCLLHSYANPVHEQRIGTLLREHFPEATVSLSHMLARQWREYERTSTTVINSYILPLVGNYLEELEASLLSRSYGQSIFVSQSSGGIMSLHAARGRPVQTIMSGPAGGVMAALYVGGLSGDVNVIAFDMGGTSTDVALVHEGRVRVNPEAEVDRQPLLVPMIDLRPIGAGGGSVAWIDAGGALNVGPQSAGADPGPACYGKGGREPTVTDANLVLGRLHPQYFLAEEIFLDSGAAVREIEERVAVPLGLDTIEAASGIIDVINTKMAYAVRAITIERGLDPRDFALLAYGGAGPMHACAIARNLGMPEVIVPASPGTFSALGMLVSDVRHDFVRTFPVALQNGCPPDGVNQRFRQMVEEAIEVLEREDVPRLLMQFRRSLDMRYVGQEYTINVSLPDEFLDERNVHTVQETFHLLHQRTYGHSSREEPTEIVNLHVVAIGQVEKPDLGTLERGALEPEARAAIDEVHMYSQGDRVWIRTPVYERDRLLAGNRIEGPAIVVEKGATTVVELGFELEVKPQGHLRLRRQR